VPFDDPYQGNDPHPIVTNANTAYVPFGTFGTMDPASTRRASSRGMQR
jgi:hypothetical protein